MSGVKLKLVEAFLQLLVPRSCRIDASHLRALLCSKQYPAPQKNRKRCGGANAAIWLDLDRAEATSRREG
jgi:hypothetical protein